MNTRLIHDKIMDGTIRSWPDVYGYTTLQEMVDTLGRDKQHWGMCRANPLRLTIEDMDRIMEVFDISRKRFLMLVEGED